MAAVQEIHVGDSAARVQQIAPAADELPDIHGEKMVLNMGPSHPSTHGVLRIVLELDGEIITKAVPDVGYLHRGDEKIAENMTYTQFIPYTDRLDYLAPLANNVAYALAVEKLMGIEKQLPPRCQYIRVICCELARISAHLLGLGAFAMDVGALTVFPAHVHGARENLQPVRIAHGRAFHHQLYAYWRRRARPAARLGRAVQASFAMKSW
jgi:NADH-quinone oxidoreductase subunit D